MVSMRRRWPPESLPTGRRSSRPASEAPSAPQAAGKRRAPRTVKRRAAAQVVPARSAPDPAPELWNTTPRLQQLLLRRFVRVCTADAHTLPPSLWGSWPQRMWMVDFSRAVHTEEGEQPAPRARGSSDRPPPFTAIAEALDEVSDSRISRSYSLSFLLQSREHAALRLRSQTYSTAASASVRPRSNSKAGRRPRRLP